MPLYSALHRQNGLITIKIHVSMTPSPQCVILPRVPYAKCPFLRLTPCNSCPFYREPLYDGRGSFLRDRVEPAAMLPDEVDQSIDGFDFRDIELHGLFADIKIDLTGGAPDIPEICICHFARAIYDTTHDRDFDPF